MSKVKSRLRQAVTSSIINRSSMEDLFIQQPSEVPTYAPFDDPDNKVFDTNKKNLDFKYLSRTEFSVLDAIHKMVQENSSGVTNPVYLKQFADLLGNPVSTVKKIIQKLEKKKIIIRGEYKSGRGGWTCYKLPRTVSEKLDKV